MDIDLPNKCYITEPHVSPKNWNQKVADITRPWVIHYTFYDPNYPKGFRRQLRGMNNERTLLNRRIATRQIIEAELKVLREGFNPFKKTFVATETNFEVNAYTPFIEALWTAVKKIRASEGHIISLKSVVRGVEKSARQLDIHRMALRDVTMKYFNRIFEQCYKNNSNFTGSTHNRYKKSLHRIYRELFKMEAIETNPLALIEKVRATKQVRVMPTEKERKKINKFLKTKRYTFWRAIQLFFHSGAREAEFMRLQVKDVNLKTQECTYTIEKGIEVREGVIRPIKKTVLPLWREIVKDAKPNDYIFSVGLKPGPKLIRREQFSRRWRLHVKKKLGINVQLYSLKHLNTTQVMDELDRFYNPAKDVARMNAHNEAMVVSIYDKNNKSRRDSKIKNITNKF